MVYDHFSEISSLVFMAIALGLDSFSVSLGMGMQEIRLKRIAIIGIIFGLFHIVLPFLGIVLGQVISTKIGHITTLASGLLLVVIGTQMIFLSFNNQTKKKVQPYGIGLLILGMSVSIDSFSVGLSLGISGVKSAIALLLFGVSSMVLTWAGMLLGRKVHGFLGVYSEILGGSILCTFGLIIVFN